MLGIIGTVFFGSIMSIFLCGIVSGVLWLNGFLLVDVIVDKQNVDFVLINQKRVRTPINDIIKVDNYRNYIFVIKTADKKVFIARDSVTSRLLVTIDGKAHIGINKEDFPKAEYCLH